MAQDCQREFCSSVWGQPTSTEVPLGRHNSLWGQMAQKCQVDFTKYMCGDGWANLQVGGRHRLE